MEKIKVLQNQEDGIPFDLKLKNQIYNVRLRTPILTFIGDNEGLDKLCAMYSNRIMSKTICRNCGSTTENCDNPDGKFVYTNQNNINKLIQLNKKRIT